MLKEFREKLDVICKELGESFDPWKMHKGQVTSQISSFKVEMCIDLSEGASKETVKKRMIDTLYCKIIRLEKSLGVELKNTETDCYIDGIESNRVRGIGADVSDEFHPVLVNDEVVCYATSFQNAKLVSQVIYHMRGFFVSDFSDPRINVGEPVVFKEPED